MGSGSTKHDNGLRERFVDCCRKGKLEDVMQMLTENESQNKSFLNSACGANEMYGTHLAAEGGHAHLLELLLQHGADPMLKTVRGNTALHIAARSGQSEAVRVILRSLSEEMWQRARLLWVACKKPNDGQSFPRLPPDMIRLLTYYLMRDCLSTNAMICHTNNDGATALDLAMKNRETEVVKLLLNQASASTIREGVLGSPLHAAAAYGIGEGCRLICRTTADANTLNRRGETPLFRACCAYPETEATVKCLLSLRADPTIRANDGRSPLEEAEARKYTKSAKLIKDALIKNGM